MTEATKPEPVPCSALITHISLKNDGFARHPDTAEAIYIPPAVTSASGLVDGEVRDVHIVPNFPDKRDTIPWLGVYVSPPQQSMPEAHKIYTEGGLASFRTTEDRVYRYLMGMSDVYATTKEVAQAVGVEPSTALRMLNRLYRDQRIVRADVREPNKPEIVANLWAVRVEDFTG